MAVNYAYKYAVIDETGWCYEVKDTTTDCSDLSDHIPVPEYNEDYLDKYYNRADGKWYLDASFTTEWIPT